jgi:hypothetical protein
MATRKSKVHRLPHDVRSFVEKLLREDKHTLDEMLLAIREQFPAAETPSRSSLHRYRYKFDEMTKRLREQREIAELIVGELGDGIGEKSAQLLSQAVTTIVTHAALDLQDSDETSIEDARKLARAARDAVQVQKISRQERQAIEEAARERLKREQQKTLDAMGKRGDITPEALRKIRTEVYGLPE